MIAEAIVVLGCTLRGGEPSRALARRIDLGARAFSAGLAPCVIASGGRRWQGEVEAVAMRRALSERGVDDHAIHMELCSLTTRDNAHFSALLMRKWGARRALVATCPWHLPRARRDFERCGIAVVDPPEGWLDDATASSITRLRERLWRLLI